MHFNFLNILVNRNQYPLIFTYLFRVLGVRCTQIPYVVKYINVKIQNTWENRLNKNYEFSHAKNPKILQSFLIMSIISLYNNYFLIKKRIFLLNVLYAIYYKTFSRIKRKCFIVLICYIFNFWVKSIKFIIKSTLN